MPGDPNLTTHDDVESILYYAPSSSPPVADSVSFTFDGPTSSQTLPATPESCGVKAAFSPKQKLPAGSYSVTAQWQVGWDDGSTQVRTAPPKRFTVSEWTPSHAQGKVSTLPRPGKAIRQPVQAGAGIACPVDNGERAKAENLVDEPITAELFLTLDGSLPTRASRRYAASAPHGCKTTLTAEPRPPKTNSLSGGQITIRRGPGGVNVSMLFRSRVRVLRALLVVRSGDKVLAAGRVRFVHSGKLRMVIRRDSGPCPVPCRLSPATG